MRKTTLLGSVVFVAAITACSTVGKVNKVLDSANQAAQNVAQLTKNLNDAITSLKAKATTPATTAPNAAASLPALPAKATGGVDTGKPVSAKTGSGTADVEGSGTPQDVNVTVTDAPATSTQSLHTLDLGADDATTFLSWKGSADDGDDGECYLAWEHGGKAWFVISKCGDTTAHVCSDDGTTATCSACNEAGTCSECDENQPLSACTVQAGEAPDGGPTDDAGDAGEGKDAGPVEDATPVDDATTVDAGTD
jgi:hypothetical protein